MVGDRATYVFDVPPTAVEISDLEDVPFEAQRRKNEELVKPDLETKEQDILLEKRKELLMFEEWDAFKLVPPEETYPMKFVDVRWVVDWRGTDGWRCRCVVREYRWLEYRDDPFAATTSSNTARLIDGIAVCKKQPTFTSHATKAYLQVPEEELIYVKPPEEYRELLRERGLREDLCWQMTKVIYGRRTTATKWVHHVSSMMKRHGFVSFAGCPYLFYHSEKQVALGVSKSLESRDSYEVGGGNPQRRSEDEAFREAWLKCHVLPLQEGSRANTRDDESDPEQKAHSSDSLAARSPELQPSDHACASKGTGEGGKNDNVEIDSEARKSIRILKCIGILAYLSQERPDIQFGCRVLASGQSCPTN
eukprot:211639-Amphidinium_carterae.3